MIDSRRTRGNEATAVYKIAFAGFRHAHIFDLFQRVSNHPNLELIATAEEDFRGSLMPVRDMRPDFDSLDAMLESTDVDIVALGDAYGKRGAQAITALKAGKHVIADKPLCTSHGEFLEIESLAKENGLCIGLMLDLRDHSNWITLREILQSGRIGEPLTVTFSAQHPLLWGTRPAWYFETGMHGGTLNDIGIHAVDFIPWLTGTAIQSVVAARTWNAKADGAPHFQDCAQVMLKLSNGGGVLGDVSYLAPDACGFASENYWRVTVHGKSGFAETSYNANAVTVASDRCKEPECVTPVPGRPGGYLDDFLAEIADSSQPNARTTESNLRATRLALEMEAAAVDNIQTPPSKKV